jgi:hypothetical protein
MDPLIGGAISFGASALSSLFNNRSQRKTNQMNYKIMQETELQPHKQIVSAYLQNRILE